MENWELSGGLLQNYPLYCERIICQAYSLIKFPADACAKMLLTDTIEITLTSGL